MTASNMLLILLIILIGIPLTFFMESLWLWLTTKIFNIEDATYKKALKISTIFLIVGMVVGVIITILFAAINLINIGIVANIVIGFFIANFLYKKYYLTETKKNIWIYIVKSIFGGLVAPLTLGLVIILPIRMYVAQPFFMEGSSMEPNVKDGQYILIKEFDKNYKRGEIIVFKYPKNEKQYFLKRIVGLPGEKIEIRDNAVYVNGETLNEGEYLNKSVKTAGNVSIELKNDEYFVLGDNREFSHDSRVWGPLKNNLIIGKYWMKVYGVK